MQVTLIPYQASYPHSIPGKLPSLHTRQEDTMYQKVICELKSNIIKNE